jgi:predicted site-specific integrase-resolvase
MDNTKYISPSKISKQFDISSGTLRNWAEAGKIDYLRPNGSRRVYNVEDVARIFGSESKETNKKTYLYARVSSSHQKEDLERQATLLQENYPDGILIKDVGSGISWKRPGMRRLLEHVHAGDVETIVVTYRDRICRFGFELIDWIFKKAAVKLVVLGQDTKSDRTNELAEDLLAITTVFVAKNNGLRAGKLRRLRSTQGSKEGKEGSGNYTETTENN